MIALEGKSCRFVRRRWTRSLLIERRGLCVCPDSGDVGCGFVRPCRLDAVEPRDFRSSIHSAHKLHRPQRIRRLTVLWRVFTPGSFHLLVTILLYMVVAHLVRGRYA